VANIIQFVDAISASPNVRLDLNNVSTANALAVDVPGIDLSPPPLRRTVFSSMLTDGDYIGSAAFENRVIKLGVRLIRVTGNDGAGTVVQGLARELNRLTNILKVQLDGASSPVFFRTYRAPDHVLSMLRFLLSDTGLVTLEIPAEPFALGLEESLGSFLVKNDPAAVPEHSQGDTWLLEDDTGGYLLEDGSGIFELEFSTPLYFDVPAPYAKGDVPTPLYIRTNSNLAGAKVVLATRRRGNPSAMAYYIQAKDCLLGQDTAIQSDANASGGQEVRTTFATSGTSFADRISATLPMPAPGPENRGTYRVFARHQRPTAGLGGLNSKLRYAGGVSGIETEPPDSTTYQLVDYGILQIPWGSKGERDGYGAELAANGVNIALRIQRLSGATTQLDTDYILLLPADAELAMVNWPTVPVGPQWVFDGPNDDVYWRSNVGTPHTVSATGIEFPTFVGGLPMITPDQDNRIFFVNATGSITASAVLEVSYFPRYLTVRPAAT
jgi:hypothetical protein